MRSLLKSSLVLSLSEILLKGAKLVSFVVIANVYSLEYFSTFNYVVSFLLIFSIVGELGINTYITTQQSTKKSFPEKSILALGVFKLLSVGFVLSLSFGVYMIFHGDHHMIFILTALLIFCDAMLTMIYAFYRAIHNYRYEFYLKVAQAIIYMVTAIGLYYWAYVDFLYFLCLIVFLNVWLALYGFYVLTEFNVCINEVVMYVKKDFVEHFKYIFPIFIATVFTTLYFRIDILMLESMLSIESVGYYSVAYKLVEGAMVLPLMLGIVFLPKLSQKRKNVVQDLFVHFVLGMMIWMVFYVSVGSLIEIMFAPHYTQAIDVAHILSYSIVIMSVNTYMFSYFIANNYAYVNVQITFMMLISNVLLNYFLIPMYGMSGAAYSTIGTECVGMLMLIYFMKRYYHVNR